MLNYAMDGACGSSASAGISNIVKLMHGGRRWWKMSGNVLDEWILQ